MSTKKQEIHESSHIHEHEHEHEHGHPHTHEHEHGHHHKNTKAVLNRMSRAIGHMEAVRTMIEDGRDCSEVLIQIAAVRSAINNIGKIILEDHINHCVVDAVETGDTQVLKDLDPLFLRVSPCLFYSALFAQHTRFFPDLFASYNALSACSKNVLAFSYIFVYSATPILKVKCFSPSSV